MRRRRWPSVLWGALWLGTPAALRLVLVRAGGAPLPVAALGATLGAAALAALGWGLRPEGASAPRWGAATLPGAALLATLLGAGALAAAGRLALLPLALAAWGAYHLFLGAGLPPGFAPRLTAVSRLCALAALPLWSVALAAQPGALLTLPPVDVGVAAYLGVGPLCVGSLLWEQQRTARARGRRPEVLSPGRRA